FSTRQHVEVESSSSRAAFDAVLEKHDDDLVLVGLGPAGVRAFVLRQSGDTITHEQSFGPRFPFPPRTVIVAIHRACFKRLPRAPQAQARTLRGTLDGEEVEDDWRDGQLLERRFARPDSRFHGVVRITYGDGCRADRCAPVSFTIANEWFGYTLRIAN